MEKQSLTHKALKNISYNFFGYIWGFVFAIFITPIIVFGLGIESYGVYVFLGTIGSLMGLLDLGLSTAVIKYIAEYSATGKEEKLKDLLYSANSLFLIIGLAGLAVFFVLGFFAADFLPGYSLKDDLLLLFVLAGLVFFVNAINSTFVVALIAMQRFDLGVKIGLFSLTLSNLTTLALVLAGYRLVPILFFQVVFSIISFFIQYHYAIKILPQARLKFKFVKSEIITCYKFGVVASISNIASSSLTYLDRLIIPFFLGTSALSYYSLPGSIANKTLGVSNSLSSIIFPSVSSLHGVGDKARITSLYSKSFRLLTIVNVAMVSAIIIFANKMLLYWLNEDFADKTTSVLIILALTYFVLSLSGPLVNFLLGLGKTRLLAINSSIIAIINAILLFILLPEFGIIGAAWAYLISVLPVFYLFYYTEKIILQLTGRFYFYMKFYAKLLGAFLIFFLVCHYLFLPFVNSFKAVLFFGPLSVLTYLVLYKLLGFFEEEDWQMIKSFSVFFFKKISFKK